METAFYSEIKCQPAALRATLAAYEKNDFALIKEAIALISRAPALVMSGMGTSYNVCLCALKGLAGIQRVNAVQSYQLLQNDCAEIRDGDLLLLISQSGESAEIVELCSRRRGKNRIICITNDVHSSLAKAASLVLPLYCIEEKSITNCTFTASLAVLQLLCACAQGSSLHALASELLKASDEAESFLSSESEIFALADSFAGIDRVHFIGRSGLEMSLAEQAALTFKEGANINAACFSAGSFRHGPMELCGEKHTAILFVSDNESADALGRLARLMRANGSNVIFISNKPFDERGLRIQAGSPEAFAAVAAIIVEMLIVRSAQQRGKEAGVFTIAKKICKEI